MQLKFRVWDLNARKWLDDENKFAISLTGNLMENHYWYDDTPGNFDEDQWTDSRENVIIQQFTGLKDKNNLDIYDGDIVKYISHCDYLGHIEVSIITEVKLDYKTNLDRESGGGPDGQSWSEEIEIIGNIFENPKLLKEIK